VLPFLLCIVSLVHGSEIDIPRGSPNCALVEPPEAAGAYATPGGFLLVYPRNAQLPNDYTGCKSIWLVDTFERTPLLMTGYFEQGRLRIARVFEGRGESKPRVTCVLSTGGETCKDVESNPLANLYLPTWPKACMTQPDLPVCIKEPD
jgi:hypothetical protein